MNDKDDEKILNLLILIDKAKESKKTYKYVYRYAYSKRIYNMLEDLGFRIEYGIFIEKREFIRITWPTLE